MLHTTVSLMPTFLVWGQMVRTVNPPVRLPTRLTITIVKPVLSLARTRTGTATIDETRIDNVFWVCTKSYPECDPSQSYRAVQVRLLYKPGDVTCGDHWCLLIGILGEDISANNIYRATDWLLQRLFPAGSETDVIIDIDLVDSTVTARVNGRFFVAFEGFNTPGSVRQINSINGYYYQGALVSDAPHDEVYNSIDINTIQPQLDIWDQINYISAMLFGIGILGITMGRLVRGLREEGD